MLSEDQKTSIKTKLSIYAPEFAKTSKSVTNYDDIVDFYITDTSENIDPKKFSDEDYLKAVLYLTAHNLTNKNPLGIDTNLLRKKIGSVIKTSNTQDKTKKETWFSVGSKKGNNSKALNSDYSTTEYGIDFFHLLEKNKGSVNRILVI